MSSTSTTSIEALTYAQWSGVFAYLCPGNDCPDFGVATCTACTGGQVPNATKTACKSECIAPKTEENGECACWSQFAPDKKCACYFMNDGKIQCVDNQTKDTCERNTWIWCD